MRTRLLRAMHVRLVGVRLDVLLATLSVLCSLWTRSGNVQLLPALISLISRIVIQLHLHVASLIGLPSPVPLVIVARALGVPHLLFTASDVQV